MVEGYDLELAFMVDNQDPEAAATSLRSYRDLLSAAVRATPDLGGRVPFRSPFVSFDFTPPFVEYEDGTTGREMTMQLTVGDLVEVENWLSRRSPMTRRRAQGSVTVDGVKFRSGETQSVDEKAGEGAARRVRSAQGLQVLEGRGRGPESTSGSNP